jgi:hypothetical protein
MWMPKAIQRWRARVQQWTYPEDPLSLKYLGYDVTWDVHGHCHLWQNGGEVERPALQAFVEHMRDYYGEGAVLKTVERKGSSCNDYQ